MPAVSPFRKDRGEPDWSRTLARARARGNRRWILAGTVVLIALIWWLDVATGPGREPTALYDIPIIIGAAIAGTAGGLGATVLCVAAYMLSLRHHHEAVTLADLSQMILFLLVGVIFARLVSEYMRARALQASLRDWNAQLERRIAEAIEAERETHRRLQDAERLSTMGQAAAQIAHEINNPLTAIGGFARRIESQIPGDHPAREGLGVIREEVQRLELLLRDLLDFSRPGRALDGRVELPEVVEQVCVILREAAQRSGVQVITTIGEPPPPVTGDAGQLKRALLNIALNGVQAMPEGGELTIHLEARAHGGRPGARLVVRDQGRGIPQEHMASIFEPFFTTRHGGTGLGLPLVKKTVEAHGGIVEVESSPQGGTILALWLPCGNGPRGAARQ